MSGERVDHAKVAEIRRLRAAMQAAQVHYERVLQEDAPESGAAAEAENAMSEAHAAYEAYLNSFAGRLGG